jgi:hypothetical protein
LHIFYHVLSAPFDSPLSTYHVREYDIEVSIVPYDVERTGGDKMSSRSNTTTLAWDAAARGQALRTLVDKPNVTYLIALTF